jgi:hypothetical protein
MGEIHVPSGYFIFASHVRQYWLQRQHIHTHPSPRNGELPMPGLCLPSSRSRQHPSHQLRAHSSCNHSGARTEAKYFERRSLTRSLRVCRCWQAGTRSGTRAAACWRAIHLVSTRWCSGQTDSCSPQHPATRQCECERRRRARVAACWKADLRTSTISRSR